MPRTISTGFNPSVPEGTALMEKLPPPNTDKSKPKACKSSVRCSNTMPSDGGNCSISGKSSP